MRTSLDQMGKQLLTALLRPSCEIVSELEIAHDPQAIDLLASPGPGGAPTAAQTGLLARLVQGPTLLEPYSRTVGAVELDACQRRQLAWLHQRELEQPEDVHRRPRTWLLSPGRPNALIAAFGFVPAPGWPAGVYDLAPGFALGVVVLRDLPRERDTLPLRLLGRRRTLQGAFEDVRSLPAEDPLREPIWRVLQRMRAGVILDELPEDEREAWMLTEAQFEKFKQDLVQQGLREGERQGLRQAILDMCEVLGIALDPERQHALEAMDLPELQALRHQLKSTRRWS